MFIFIHLYSKIFVQIFLGCLLILESKQDGNYLRHTRKFQYFNDLEIYGIEIFAMNGGECCCPRKC
jgi:hypothetical protein